MNLQFLQVGMMSGRMAAFFLDAAANRVHAYPVEDHTQSMVPVPMPPYNFPAYSGTGDTPPPNYPDKPKSIVPPGIASLMVPDGPPPSIS